MERQLRPGAQLPRHESKEIYGSQKQDWKQKAETIGDNIRFGGVEKTGAPGGIRTPNPQIRSLMLYPVELRARFV